MDTITPVEFSAVVDWPKEPTTYVRPGMRTDRRTGLNSRQRKKAVQHGWARAVRYRFKLEAKAFCAGVARFFKETER